ncbi:hypothetical protein WKI72_05615 [Candidatus Erwinia dacicola]
MTMDMTTIPNPIYKPGAYFAFNTTLASRALASNDQKLLIIAQRLHDSATVDALTPVNVFSDDEAALYFGRGSQAHRMARAAIKANQYIQLTVVGLDDAEAGVAATGSVVVNGTASGSGQVRLGICGTTVAVAVSQGDKADDVMASLASAITLQDTLPLSATVGETDGPVTGDAPRRKSGRWC